MTPRVKVLLLLLIVVGGAWFFYQKSNSSAPGSGTVTPAGSGTPAETASSPATQTESAPVGADPGLSRDVFHLPNRLMTKLKQKEEEYLRLKNHPEPDPSDPRTVPAIPPVILSDLKLQGLFWNKGVPQALINRKTVSEGAQVSGVTVKKILKDRVIVQAQGQESELILQTKDQTTDENPSSIRPL